MTINRSCQKNQYQTVLTSPAWRHQTDYKDCPWKRPWSLSSLHPDNCLCLCYSHPGLSQSPQATATHRTPVVPAPTQAVPTIRLSPPLFYHLQSKDRQVPAQGPCGLLSSECGFGQLLWVPVALSDLGRWEHSALWTFRKGAHAPRVPGHTGT